MVAANPFPEDARERPSQLVVAFGHAAASLDLPEKLRVSYDGPERLAAVGREMYIDFSNGQGRSPLWTEIAKLGYSGVGTGRNWNTVSKLQKAMQDYQQPSAETIAVLHRFGSRPHPRHWMLTDLKAVIYKICRGRCGRRRNRCISTR